ncbi:MAG TPA: type I 3-dehydroquinate dehydratase [Chthoniobacterales bacterium]|nr:type I 3-dehydroquinate dehydratase [Chthoniobacterales bacterium]
MPTRSRKRKPQLVGVIASLADLRFALHMRQPPDLFELRLDCLCEMVDQLERKMSILSAPVIITARDPREGGIANLSLAHRRDLLLRFLPYAKYIDVELRSARAFKSLLERARQEKVFLILSLHDFKSTPSPGSLRSKASLAKALGADIFKIACRTDSPAQLARLINFVPSKGHAGGRRDGRRQVGLSLSAMGIGKLGVLSRLLLARSGSVLNYCSLHKSQVEGQPSIELLRSALRP